MGKRKMRSARALGRAALLPDVIAPRAKGASLQRAGWEANGLYDTWGSRKGEPMSRRVIAALSPAHPMHVEPQADMWLCNKQARSDMQL